MWMEGFQMALSGLNPLFLLLGTFIGLVVGVLPAVGPEFWSDPCTAFHFRNGTGRSPHLSLRDPVGVRLW